MILTPREYAERFTVGKRKVTEKTIIRRAEMKMLPHPSRKLPGKKGSWVIEVDFVPDQINK